MKLSADWSIEPNLPFINCKWPKCHKCSLNWQSKSCFTLKFLIIQSFWGVSLNKFSYDKRTKYISFVRCLLFHGPLNCQRWLDPFSTWYIMSTHKKLFPSYSSANSSFKLIILVVYCNNILFFNMIYHVNQLYPFSLSFQQRYHCLSRYIMSNNNNLSPLFSQGIYILGPYIIIV